MFFKCGGRLNLKWQGERVKKFSIKVQQVGRRKSRMLNNPQNLGELKIQSLNRLEKLSGKLKDHYSIRINAQWRIIFRWKNNNACKVEITDYN